MRNLAAATVWLLSGSLAIAWLSTATEATAGVRSNIGVAALSGVQAPASAPGVTLQSVDYTGAAINRNGQVAFSALLSDGNVGLYTASTPANVALVTTLGQAAFGAAGTQYQDLSLIPAINTSGQVSFTSRLTGSGVTPSNDQGIWRGSPAVSRLFEREGGTTPVAGVRFGAPPAAYPNYTANLNANGETAFLSTLQDNSGNPIAGTAVWATTFMGPYLIARTGVGAVPKMSASSTYTDLKTPGIADNTNIVFSGAFNDPAGPVVNGTGIWHSEFSSALVFPIATSGMHPAGTAAGVMFQDVWFGETDMGSNAFPATSGAATYFGSLTGPGVIAGVNDQGVWSGNDAMSRLVARTGDAAPGVSGATFTALLDARSTTVLAKVSGPGVTSANEIGLWQGTAGPSLHLVVRNGDLISDGANPPALVSGLDFFTTASNGAIVFQSSADGAILGQTNNGRLAVIARPDDTILIGPGDARRIQSVRLLNGGYSGGQGTPINIMGSVAFAATFTDGTSAILVSNEIVPEPSSITIAAMGGIALLASMRWRARRAISK